MNQDDDLIDNVATRFSVNSSKFNIQTIQDVDPVKQVIDFEKKYGDNGFTDGRRMRKVGSIPNVFVLDPRYRAILDGNQAEMEEAVKRFFADHPEYSSSNDQGTKYHQVITNLNEA